jgi:murein DD-endopeptidase MepM/ murein hydrolase activator NlpD
VIRRRLFVIATLLLLGGASLFPSGTSAAAVAEIPPPPPSFYRPIVIDGFTFPIARTNWFNPIHWTDDWHAPRSRVINGQWVAGAGFHEGNDIFSAKGTPILAMRAGRVEAVGWTFYSGTRVGIRGDDGRYYLYAHLSGVAPGIIYGAPVAVGQMLGLMGNTGYGNPGTSGKFPVHLHFGIEEGSSWVNPYPLLVELYEASADATARGERLLARYAREGDINAYQALAEALYGGVVGE